MSNQTGVFQRIPTVTPPIKGSFPLDHERACKLEMIKYMVCLREHHSQNEKCRPAAMDYFKCRMDSGLMARDDWSKLGFKDLEDARAAEAAGTGEKAPAEVSKR